MGVYVPVVDIPGTAANASALGGAAAAGFAQKQTIVQFDDVTLIRSGAPTTGALFLGNSGSKYLFWDGTQYSMPGGALAVSSITGNAASVTNGVYTTTIGSVLATLGAGVIGTLAFAQSNVTNIAPGATVSGANLWYSNTNNLQGTSIGSGTWQCLGNTNGGALATLFRRIA